MHAYSLKQHMTSHKVAKYHVHLLLKPIIGFFFISTSAFLIKFSM